jgi:hypothetical protein
MSPGLTLSLVYTHTWLDAQKAAFPDFSMNHKCRDFDAVLRWHDDNSVPLEKFGAIRRPEDFEPHIMVTGNPTWSLCIKLLTAAESRIQDHLSMVR